MPKNIFKRGEIFWARFKVRGQQYSFSLRTRSIIIAERQLKAERARIEAAAYFGAHDPVSWQAAVIAWHSALARLALKPDTAKRYLVSLGQVREWLDGKDVQTIDGLLIKTIIRDRSRRGATNATIRRDLTAIASVLSVAVDEGWIEDNPAHAIDRGRIKERRDPMMLPQENSIAAVIAAKSRFTDVAEFALETGMREAEILGLGHDRIDRDRRVAMLYETKTRRLRAVPLSALAMAIIDRQPQYLHSSFVFWRGDGASFKNFSSQFYKHVTRVLQKALQSGCPLTRFRFHDLRHLFAVRFLREGRGGIYDLQQILGHASIKTTEIYLDHLTPDEKRGAMQGVIQNALQDQRFAAPIIA